MPVSQAAFPIFNQTLKQTGSVFIFKILIHFDDNDAILYSKFH